jgi:hypothetical protein
VKVNSLLDPLNIGGDKTMEIGLTAGGSNFKGYFLPILIYFLTLFLGDIDFLFFRSPIRSNRR